MSSYFIGNDVLDTEEDTLLSEKIYADIPKQSIAAIQKAELDWAQCKDDTRTIETIAEPATWFNLFPATINGKHAMAFFSDRMISLKTILCTRECQQVAQLWRITLKRCRHQDQWKATNETFLKHLKYDEALQPAAQIVLGDTALLEYGKTLPETRVDPFDTTTEGLKREYVDRPQPVYQGTLISFDDVPSKANDEDMYTVSVMTNPYTHKSEHKRTWRKFVDIQVFNKGYPVGALCKTTAKRMFAYPVSDHCIRIDIYEGTDNRQHVTTHYIRASQEVRILWCTMSSNGTYFAVSDERQIYTWSETHTLVSHTLEGNIGLAALDIDDLGELTFGTTMGQIIRVNTIKREVLMSTSIPDTLVILGLVRTGGKTIIHTIRDVFIIESLTDPDDIIQIRTSRPMSISLHGTRIVCFNKYGHLLLFSTIQRQMMTEVDMGKVEINVVLPTPWYPNGIFLRPDGRSMAVYYPNGLIKVVTI